MYLAWPSKTLWCGMENLELSDGVPDEMASELEAGEPQVHADKSLLILSCFELSFVSDSFCMSAEALC